MPEPYQHPVFQIDESKLKDLLAEAQRVEEVLNSPDYMPGLLVSRLLLILCADMVLCC